MKPITAALIDGAKILASLCAVIVARGLIVSTAPTWDWTFFGISVVAAVAGGTAAFIRQVRAQDPEPNVRT